MALLRFNAVAPVRTALVSMRDWMVSLQWKPWVQLVGDRISRVTILDVAYNPPSIGAGAATTIDVSYPGASTRDFVQSVSFEPMTVGGTSTSLIRFFGNVTAPGRVSVTLLNVGGGAIDLDAGTLRIEVERVG